MTTSCGKALGDLEKELGDILQSWRRRAGRGPKVDRERERVRARASVCVRARVCVCVCVCARARVRARECVCVLTLESRNELFEGEGKRAEKMVEIRGGVIKF